MVDDVLLVVDDECYRCGYALRGIDDERPCPECGLLARRSRRVTDELHFTRPRWLRRVSRGTNLMLLAVVLLSVSPVIALVLTRLGHAMLPIRAAWVMPLIPMIGPDIVALLVLAGGWMLASREGYGPADRADRWRRAFLRLTAIAPLVGVVCFNVQRYLLFNGGFWGVFDRGMNPMLIGMLAAALVSIPLPFLLFAQLRGVARRARSAHLTEHCTIVGIGASCALAYALVVAFIVLFRQQWGLDRHWIDRSIPGMTLSLVMGVTGILFAMWSTYLLARLALALGRASRELRRGWQNDDRAAAHPAVRESRENRAKGVTTIPAECRFF